MAARGYESYLRVLKVSLTSERSEDGVFCVDFNVSFLGGNVVIVGGEVECFV